MKYIGYLMLGVVPTALALLLAGCGGGGDSGSSSIPKSSDDAASELEKTFKDAPQPAVKKQATQASKALKDKDYEKAAETLTRMQQQEGLEFNQRMQIRNSRAALEREIAEGLESNDPKERQRAKAAMRRLQQLNQQQRNQR